jgi:hypothetical protein
VQGGNTAAGAGMVVRTAVGEAIRTGS